MTTLILSIVIIVFGTLLALFDKYSDKTSNNAEEK